MKMNMIIGKKQIILASLVLVLGIAVYLNWQFAQTGQDFVVTNKTNSQTTSDKNFGDAQLVDNKNGDDYFTKARIEKQKARDTAIDTVSNMLKDSTLTEEQKNDATSKTLEISQVIEKENNIENLIKAKGFKDCVSYLDSSKANIVVKTDGLVASEAAQIKDIVLNEGKVLAENITIVEVK